MQVKVFYSCAKTGDSVASDEPIIIDKDTAIDMALQILRERGDFFGFVGINDKVIQFYREDADKVWVEHPSPKDNGSFGKYILLSEIEQVISSLPEKLHKMSLPGLEFVAW